MRAGTGCKRPRAGGLPARSGHAEGPRHRRRAPGNGLRALPLGRAARTRGAGGVNDLTHRFTDPTSRQPGLKATAVRLEPVLRAPPQAPPPPAHRRRRPVRRRPSPRPRWSTATGRSRWPTTSPRCPYDRVGLTDHLAGHREATDLPLHPKRWYREHGIAFCDAIVDVDTERRIATTASGTQLSYDALVLATGSRAFIPPIDGHRARHRVPHPPRRAHDPRPRPRRPPRGRHRRRAARARGRSRGRQPRHRGDRRAPRVDG